LKPTFPGVLTGKLSDVSGLFVAGVLTSVLARRRPVLALGGIGAVFVWWKSAASQPLIERWNAVAPFPIARVVDWTDLLALPMLGLAVAYTRSEFRSVTGKIPRVVMVVAAGVAVAATSLPPPSGVRENAHAALVSYQPNVTYVAPGARGDTLAAFQRAGFAQSYRGLFGEAIDLNTYVRCGVDDAPDRSIVAVELTVDDRRGRTEIAVWRTWHCSRSAPPSRLDALRAFESEILDASLAGVRRLE
jgi:hypothetical protein